MSEKRNRISESSFCLPKEVALNDSLSNSINCSSSKIFKVSPVKISSILFLKVFLKSAVEIPVLSRSPIMSVSKIWSSKLKQTFSVIACPYVFVSDNHLLGALWVRNAQRTPSLSVTLLCAPAPIPR